MSSVQSSLLGRAPLKLPGGFETTLLQTGVDMIVRIRGGEVRAKRLTTQSIMPLGMLNDFRATDFADLYAYLKTLSPH